MSEQIDVTKKATQLFVRFTQSWAFLEEFNRVANIGLETAVPQLYEQKTDFAKHLMYSPDCAPFILQDAAQSTYTPEKLGQLLANKAMVTARGSIQAAAIVFAHTILDTSLFDLCVLASKISPESWDGKVKVQKITMEDAKNKTYPELRQELIAKELEQLERQSIQTKINLLFKFCRGIQPSNGYKFDKDKLAKFDTLRHDIVHGRVQPSEVKADDLQEILDYVNKTGMYFIFTFLSHFGIKLNFFEEGIFDKSANGFML